MSWAAIAPYLADILVLLGLAIVTVGVVGAFRLNDIYSKLHATSVVVAFGVISIGLAALFVGELAITTRVLLIIAIIGITAPVATFSMARAAWRMGEEQAPGALEPEGGRRLVEATEE